jgi:hypothetical protein
MVHYEHAGIAYDENSARINPKLASFGSLPGELRNLAYASTLKVPHIISVKYNAATQQFQTPGVTRQDGRSPVEALKLLSDLDHNIRDEARSYFYNNHVFELETTSQSLSTDPDYMDTYIRFLESISVAGRCAIRWLRMTVIGDTKQHSPDADKALRLWELLTDCINLITLDIDLDIDYFYMDRHTALKAYMSTEGYPIGGPWPEVLEALQSSKNLKRLVLRPVFSSRWYCTVVLGEIYTEPEDHGHVRFVVHRPVDEATRLTAQLKGAVRRHLRGSVSVRVLMQERWELHGADVLIGRTVTTEEWQLMRVGRYGPFGRTFRYRA